MEVHAGTRDVPGSRVARVLRCDANRRPVRSVPPGRSFTGSSGSCVLFARGHARLDGKHVRVVRTAPLRWRRTLRGSGRNNCLQCRNLRRLRVLIGGVPPTTDDGSRPPDQPCGATPPSPLLPNRLRFRSATESTRGPHAPRTRVSRLVRNQRPHPAGRNPATMNSATLVHIAVYPHRSSHRANLGPIRRRCATASAPRAERPAPTIASVMMFERSVICPSHSGITRPSR